MSAPLKQARNIGLWDRFLPEIVAYLIENPLASASDAARKFGISSTGLVNRLNTVYPGRFDFEQRRTDRGLAREAERLRRRAERTAKREATSNGPVDIHAEIQKVMQGFDQVVEALARLEKAITKQP